MHAPATLLALLPFLSTAVFAQNITGQLGDAKIITNNVPNTTYRAVLTGKVSGSLNATSQDAGKAVSFTLEVKGLPVGAGPFSAFFPLFDLNPTKYHIHEKPVPSDGNCTGTGAHLDPYIRTQTPACDYSRPATCEVGDLSGKYGAIGSNYSSVVKIFNDLYVATNPADNSFFGNLSFVIHDASSARIACANFTKVATTGDGDACDD
ncbi:superoxide dismutase [Coniochaeta sp. 2T2.1]|nr:superoxide dismutase [Coniochaeta sp. 2T2.1]